MELKSLTLTDFKGIRGSVTYSFSHIMKIIAENGAGKSTIADGYFWLLSDKDYGLTANPNIRPNDGRECIPTVTAEFDIDGKPVTVTKMQKMKKSKPDENGIVKTSLTNSYEVNSVPKSERDFKAYLEDLGVDFNLFLPLSHPDVFLKDMNEKKQKEAIRKVLFGMGDTSTSDLDIANSDSSMKDLAELLVNYSLEEAKAMQNATKRKIAENYGKDGDILRAKIEGMEKSKVDVDLAELELGRNALKEQIAEIDGRLEDVDKRHEAYKKLSDGVLELKFKLSDMERKANEENGNKRRKIQSQIDGFSGIKEDTESRIRYNDSEISSIERNLAHKTEEIEKCRKDWQAAHERVFDENSLVCAYCGQEYPEEKKDALRAEFESHKAEELKQITEKGNELKTEIEKDKAEIERIKEIKAENEKKSAELTAQLQYLQRQYDEIPQSVDISSTDEYQNLKKEIADKEKAMADESDTDNARNELKAQRAELQRQLSEIEGKFEVVKNNERIDREIEKARAEGIQFEQAKADCERILYQVDLLNKRKNDLLEESINRNFKFVRWRMYKYQKNGEYLDDCTPLIDGKDINSECNGALRVLAKLDIVFGLQNFYGQHYPVFVDDFALVTGNTEARIEPPCQLIELVAKEGVKELKFEEIA